jgi:hypothetical protein
LPYALRASVIQVEGHEADRSVEVEPVAAEYRLVSLGRNTTFWVMYKLRENTLMIIMMSNAFQ